MKNSNSKANKVLLTILWTVLVFTAIGFVLELLYCFRSGNVPDWSGFGTVCACLAIGFSCVYTNEKKQKDEQ